MKCNGPRESHDRSESCGSGMRAATAKCDSSSLDLSQYPYLQRVERLQKAYPALQHLIAKQKNIADEGRQLVSEWHTNSPGSTPGRCAVLIFHDDHVEHERTLESAQELAEYLENAPPARDVLGPKRRRLFVLEDMEPGFVDTLGCGLGVNPMIFSEQLNTWNFTDSRSVSYRSLPSVANPEALFTIRYYELRTLDQKEDTRKWKAQYTFAVNRRKFEYWRDLELKSVQPDPRHSVIRRCASFWTGHGSTDDHWDAVILVDPPLDSCDTCAGRRSDPDGKPYPACQPSCLKLEDPTCYETRKDLWSSRCFDQKGSVEAVRHRSRPYHGGITTLARPDLFSYEGIRQSEMIESQTRNQASIFDELIFYWTKCPHPQAIEASKQGAVNSAYYLLKYVAAAWDNHLEFIAYNVECSEWFKDDHEAGMDTDAMVHDWKRELTKISTASKDINSTRRKISQYLQAVTLNMERMGMQLGAEKADADLPLALRHAQKDFLAIYSRLIPLGVRVDNLSSIANDVASLRAAFKSIEDGANGLRLSLFLAVIFPLTLVASMLSMGDDFLPGKKNFWVFWASSIPLAFVIGACMMFNHIWARWLKWKRGKALREYNLARPLHPITEQV